MRRHIGKGDFAIFKRYKWDMRRPIHPRLRDGFSNDNTPFPDEQNTSSADVDQPRMRNASRWSLLAPDVIVVT